MNIASGPGSVSALVPSWNGRQHLEAGLPSLLEQRRDVPGLEIVVLDNGSTDGSAELLSTRFPEVRVIRSERNLGFAGGSNRLAEAATGELLLFVNNDTRLEPGWAARLLDTLASAPADVAAVAGRIVDWGAERLDFGRGVMTFDGHALAVDQGRPLGAARTPRTGDELLFGCGGNLLVRGAAFREIGGFDAAYFAYFEDVDLGWRLWAAGHRVVACAEAVVRHRLSASSSRLGDRRRGLLFERNALWTMLKNLEPALRHQLMPAVLLTYLSRLSAMVGEETPLGIPGTGETASRQWPRQPMRARLARHGAGALLRRGAAKALRALAEWMAPRAPAIELASDRTAAQLGALEALFAGLPDLADRRRLVQAARRRSDREIFERFPLWIVPAYPGDAALFESSLFAELLPAELRFERTTLTALRAAAEVEPHDRVVEPRA